MVSKTDCTYVLWIQLPCRMEKYKELLSPPTDREKELLAIIYGNHAAMSLGARTESSSHTQTKTKPKTQLPTSFFILTLDPVRVEVAEQ